MHICNKKKNVSSLIQKNSKEDKAKVNGFKPIFSIKLSLLKQEKNLLEYQLAHLERSIHLAADRGQTFFLRLV